MTRMVDADELMSSSDIADLLGYTRATVSHWKTRDASFPKPVASIAGGQIDVYLRSDIERWRATKNPRSQED